MRELGNIIERYRVFLFSQIIDTADASVGVDSVEIAVFDKLASAVGTKANLVSIPGEYKRKG